MACPLLEGRLEGAHRLLLNVTGGGDLGLLEVNQAVELVSRTVDADANIIFGAVIDPALSGGRVKVTLVATGFGDIPPASLSPRPEQISERAPASQASGQAPALASREEDTLREMPPFLHFRRS
jgi:cell division protein FtsZ